MIHQPNRAHRHVLVSQCYILNWLPPFKLSRLSSCSPVTLGLQFHMATVKGLQLSRGCPLKQGLCFPGSYYSPSLGAQTWPLLCKGKDSCRSLEHPF